MTQKEFIEELSKKTTIKKSEVRKLLDAFSGIIYENVAKGEKVALTGFGVFDLGKRAARRGVDPRTKKDIKIPAMKMPRFRFGSNFKKSVR